MLTKTIKFDFLHKINNMYEQVIDKSFPSICEESHLRYSSEISTFYQHDLTVRNTTNVTGGMPIPVLSQYISGVSAVNP
jgi:hypothetical protein